MNDDIRRLEEKIAYLEHHVTQQDKAMLEMAEALERLKRDLAVLALRAARGAEEREGGAASPEDERPPHY